MNANQILSILKKTYPDAKTSLDYRTPIDILVATILSAQCTDIRVNIVTKELFKKYKKVEDYANANLNNFEQDIKSTGFYKNKAKNIIATAKKIVKEHNSKVPVTMEELTSLLGVGRKTANVVISNVTKKHVGIVVDTHVSRLSQRIGLTKKKDAVKIEQDLVKLFPKTSWGFVSIALIYHGRKYCTARKVYCSECPLNKLCKSAFKV